MKKASSVDGLFSSALVAPVGATSVATAPDPRAAPAPGNPIGYKDRALWLWVAGGFLVLAIMWAILLTVAHSAKIESVPLAAQPGKP